MAYQNLATKKALRLAWAMAALAIIFCGLTWYYRHIAVVVLGDLNSRIAAMEGKCGHAKPK